MSTVTNPERAPNDLTGQRCGGSYELIRQLGVGGGGEVWLARALRLDNKEAAVKVLSKEAHSKPEHQQRFAAEVRVVGSLRTNSVVEVWDAGTLPDGRHYMIMEFCDGGSLGALLQQRGRLSLDDTLTFTIGPALALRAAHAAGIIHRDVKPDNILLLHEDDRMTAKLSDFGIAKLISERLNVQFKTGTMRMMGTPGYMAPEQINPKDGIDLRADIFSFGCVLYQCLTGHLPYPTGNLYQYIEAVMARPVRPINPRVLRPEISPELDALVMDCLELDRHKRPPSIDVVMRRFAQAIPNGDRLLRFFGRKFLDEDRAIAPTAPTISESVGFAAAEFVFAPSMNQKRRGAFRRSITAFAAGALLAGIVATLFARQLGLESASECGAVATAPLVAPSVTSAPTSPPPAPMTPSATPTTPAAFAPALATKPAEVAVADRATSSPTSQRQGSAAPPAPPRETASDASAKPPDTEKPSATRKPQTPQPLTRTQEATQTAAKPRNGVIAVSVKQTWAQVWIDGTYQESTPVRATVTAGTHKVLLVGDGHRETVTVTVPAGGESTIVRDW
jgi:eukaryotic-like serine/threonine-protein kinase